MKPRNVVEFSHGLRASAIQFFNDVEKYVDLMVNTLVEKDKFDSYCDNAFSITRSELTFMKSLMIQETDREPIFRRHYLQMHIDLIEKMWDDIGIYLFSNYIIDLDEHLTIYTMSIRRSYIKFINECKINAEIEEEEED